MIHITTKTKNRLSKVISVTTSVTTALWMTSSAFIAPLSVNAAVTINDGDIFRASNDYKVYIAKHVGAAKYKRWFVGPQMFDFYKHLSFAVVKVVDPSVAASYTESKLVRVDGTQPVYYIGNAVAGASADKQWVISLDAFNAAGFNWDMVYVINPAEGGWYTTGANFGGAVTPTTTPTGGTVGVSLAGDNPAGAVVPSNSVYNNALKLTLVGGPAQVTGVTLTKYGFMANTNITGVSVWDSAGKRHGAVATSLSSDNKVTIGFGSDPIALNGGTDSLLVRVNLGAATSGTFYFGVSSAADITTNGTVGGAFPLTGNLFSLTDGSTTIGNVKVEGVTAGGKSVSTGDGNVDIGDTQKEVAKFRFTQDNGKEDIQVESLTMYVEGDITETKDVLNWQLYDPANTVLAMANGPVDRYVTFKLATPYKIEKGLNRTLTVKVDIKDGASRWFRVQLQNDYDMLIKGVSTGAYMLPFETLAGDFNGIADGSSYFKMRSGSLTVTKASDSPSGNVAQGGSDVLLGKFNLRASGEDMEVRKLDVYVTPAVKALTGNIAVRSGDGSMTYVTIAAATSSPVYTVDTATRYDLSTYIQLQSNVDKVIAVYGSVPSDATVGDTYTAKIANFYVKRLSSIDYTNLPDTTTQYSGNALSVIGTDATVAKNTGIGDTTVPPGLSGAKIGSFVVQGGTAEDARISSIALAFTTDNYDATSIQNMLLKVGGVQQGSSIGTPSGSSNNTYSVSINVPKSTPVTIDVYADVKTGAYGNLKLSVADDGVTLIGLTTSNSILRPTDDTPLQIITFGAGNLTITKDSSSPTEQIMTPANGVLLGNWKFEAKNEDLNLKKVTFTAKVADGTTDVAALTGAGNFGTLYLKDGSTTLATGMLVPASGVYSVAFSGFNVNILASNYKVLSLYSDLTPSGTQDPGSVVTWVVKSDITPTDIDVTGSSGLLTRAAINTTGSDANFAVSTKYLYHNAKPVIAAATNTPSGSKTGQAAQELFIFTVTNSGTKDLRISSLSVTVAVSGGLVSGATWTAISDIDLYDGTTKIGNDGKQADGTTFIGSNSGSKEFVFNATNDVPGMFDNLNISSGATKTFTVKADTTLARGVLTSGQYLTVSTRIGGTTGYGSAAWNEGDVEYLYTPVYASAESGPYSASDSYPVNGGTLTY